MDKFFIIARKPIKYAEEDSPAHEEYWSGNEPWADYERARHYDTKDDAMSVAESIATHCEYVYRVIEIASDGFVECEYEV